MKSRLLVPLKHLGQNFLVDPKVKQHILIACNLKSDEEIIEIGPGLGHLTELILPCVKKIHAIEKDRRYCEELVARFPADKFSVTQEDILKFDLKQLPAGAKVIGNLPYYISTPIIERFIESRATFPECYFTVQKEFAERLVAKPNSKDYGSLTCFVQFYADVKILFKISPSAFKPAPKVTSAFIKISFRPPVYKVPDEEKLFSLIRTAFGQRRKKIANSMSSSIDKDKTNTIFVKCGLTGEERAENLSLKNFVDICVFASPGGTKQTQKH